MAIIEDLKKLREQITINENFKELSKQLTNFQEIELIYFGITENENGIRTINYNIVCNTDNIATLNIKLLATIDAICEILKTRYNNPSSNVRIEYNIITAEEFDELLESRKNAKELKLEEANILYCDNEIYTSIINTKNKHIR